VIVTSYDGEAAWWAVVARAGTASELRRAAATKRGRRRRIGLTVRRRGPEVLPSAPVLSQQLHGVASEVAEVEAAQVALDVGLTRLLHMRFGVDHDVPVLHALVHRVVRLAIDAEGVVLQGEVVVAVHEVERHGVLQLHRHERPLVRADRGAEQLSEKRRRRALVPRADDRVVELDHSSIVPTQ
jgi:hypothetical protein